MGPEIKVSEKNSHFSADILLHLGNGTRESYSYRETLTCRKSYAVFLTMLFPTALSDLERSFQHQKARQSNYLEKCCTRRPINHLK